MNDSSHRLFDRAGERWSTDEAWRRWRIPLLLIAIVLRSAQAVINRRLTIDYMAILTAAKTFLTHGTFATPLVWSSDLSKTVLRPQIYWPPGYNLLLSLPLALGRSPYVAMAFADVVSLSLFMGAFFLILDTLGSGLDPRARLFLAVLMAVINAPLALDYNDHPTDILTSGLFLMSSALMLRSLVNEQKAYPLNAWSGICAAMSTWVRYQQNALAFLPATVLFAMAVASGRRRLRFAAVLNAAVVGVLFVPILFYTLRVTHRVVPVPFAVHKEFCWGPLLRLTPFPVYAIGAVDVFIVLLNALGRLTNFDLAHQVQVALSVSLTALLFGVYATSVWRSVRAGFLRGDRSVPTLVQGGFHLLGALTLGLTTAALAWLTLKTCPCDENGFSYMDKVRYFFSSIAFVSVGIVQYAFAERASLPRFEKIVQTAVRSLLGLSLLSAVIVPVQLAHRWSSGYRSRDLMFFETDNARFANVIRTRGSAATNAVFLYDPSILEVPCTDGDHDCEGSMWERIGTAEAEGLRPFFLDGRPPIFATKQPVAAIVHVSKTAPGRYTPFLSNIVAINPSRLLGETPRERIYEVSVAALPTK